MHRGSSARDNGVHRGALHPDRVELLLRAGSEPGNLGAVAAIDAPWDEDDEDVRPEEEAASLDDEVMVTCPHCFEAQLLVVDPMAEGAFVQDCDVCCRPWQVSVSRSSSGELTVRLDPA